MTERKAASKAEDAGQAEVQAKADAEAEKGFVGNEVDPTPNEEYSMERPGSWKVPEADPKAAEKVGSSKFAGSEGGDGS